MACATFVRACSRSLASTQASASMIISSATKRRGSLHTAAHNIHLTGRVAHTYHKELGAPKFHYQIVYNIRSVRTRVSKEKPSEFDVGYVATGKSENGSAQDQTSSSLVDESRTTGKAQVLTLPTVFTILRVLAIPPVIFLAQKSDPVAALWATALFLSASLTDWLDGYLARKMKSTSSFGAFLDPVADKLMVCSVLVFLCTKSFTTGLFAAAPWVLHISAVAIVCREVAMSALREYAASLGPQAKSVVEVSDLGKYKTALQMISLTALLLSMNGGQGLHIDVGATVGPWTLILATILTWQSFTSYFLALWKYMI